MNHLKLQTGSDEARFVCSNAKHQCKLTATTLENDHIGSVMKQKYTGSEQNPRPAHPPNTTFCQEIAGLVKELLSFTDPLVRPYFLGGSVALGTLINSREFGVSIEFPLHGN